MSDSDRQQQALQTARWICSADRYARAQGMELVDAGPGWCELRMRVREAAESLIEFMQHPSHAHRLSALWVVERLKLFSLVDRIAQLAGEDPNPVVRRRARRILRKVRHVPIPPPTTYSQ